MPGLARVPLAEPVEIAIYVARRPAATLSSHADYAIDRIRDELRRAVSARPWRVINIRLRPADFLVFDVTPRPAHARPRQGEAAPDAAGNGRKAALATSAHPSRA